MAKLQDIILRDTSANRPTAGVAGRLFFATDLGKLQRDNGTSWDDVAETVAASGGYTEGAHVYHDANQAVTSGASDAYLALNSERYDTDTIHDVSTNNSRLTCKTAGKYLIIAGVEWGINGTGVRTLNIVLNRTTVIASVTVSANANSGIRQQAMTIYELGVNDYVEVRAYQNSGGNLNVLASADYSPEFSIQKVGPAAA